MADNTVEIAIKAVDQTNAAIDGAKKNLASLTGAATTAGTKAGQGLSNGFVGAEKAIGQTISRINPMLGSIVTAVGPVGIAIAGVTAAVIEFKKAWEMAEAGAAASELADKFHAITGGIAASEEMMQKLRQATKGTVADTDLMVISNRALNMGITKSADEMARLVAYFQDLGEASGMGAQESISAGMQALGALQTRGLKTLGLSLDDSKIYDDYAAKLGTVASKLDDVQKRAALVAAVLAQAPQGLVDAAGSSADKAEAMHIAVKNLNTAIGQSIQGMLGLGDAVTIVANKISSQLQRNLTSQEILLPYVNFVQQMSALDPAKAKLTADMYLLEKAFRAGRISAEEFGVALQGIVPGVMNSADATEYFAIKSYDGALASAQMMVQLGNEAAAARAAADALWIAGDATAYYNRMSSTYAAPGGYPGSSTMPGGIQLGTGGMYPGMGKSWGALTPTRTTSGGSSSGGGGGGTSYVTEARAQAAELRSIAEGLLKPSYRGPNDLIGPYIEQWDEYARKMNAIADDQNTMWRKMVPQDILDQGQEAITKWAREEEKAFYAGKRLGEVDWNKFVEDAKKQVEVQQAKEDMIAMGMRKLAEAGIAGVNAAEVLGLNGAGASAGAEMAGTFSTGLVSTDTALAVTTAFQTQMNAQAETWQSVGMLCIGWFAAGLKAGINSQTGIDIVAALFPQFKKLLGDPVKAGLQASGL